MTQLLTPGDSSRRPEGRHPSGWPSAQTVPLVDVFAALDTSPRGLTVAEAVLRRDRYGANELPRAGRRGLWRQLAAQFTDLFAIVLLVASAITFLAYELQQPRDAGTFRLAVAILAVVVLNASIGFAQEYSAERTAQSLQAMVPHTCRVLRDGERRELPARELVPGDVVVLEAGDAVPADCRLVEAHEVSVNNAALTGESDAVGRTREPVAAGPLLEARNCVFMGTDVVAGSAKAVVFATGAATEFGRIFRLAAAAPRQKTPLQLQVASMARRVAGVALAIGAALFAVRVPTGQPFVETFVFALGVMVALVPEGLPATLSVSLAIGVRRMARRHALVKQLLAVEALGSTTVVCTDKTGTLTQAEMTVAHVWAGGTSHPVSGVGYAPVGEVTDAAPVRELLGAAALCCNARLVPPPADAGRCPRSGRGGWRVLGDTTEGALLVAAAKAGIDLAAEEARAPRVAEYPFDSIRKLMSTVHRAADADTYRAYVKGAPQELLARCTDIDWKGRRRPLTDELRADVTETNDQLAAQGLRVLAAAWRPVTGPRATQDETESGLTLLGLVGMLDPPRPEVSGAVDACRRAGVRIVMVTGDHPLTAEAVARRVGIVRQAAPAIVTGARLDRMDDDALDGLLAEPAELLLCRVSPEHKMRVVTALQRRGEVVAVTGDGANDAPALKHADIGVAMGASGTDVAREAAVMVLLDDSFASIAAAVRLGRSVYQNIRKFLIYLFSHNIAELVPILAATFAGFPLVPITAVQILAIDLGSDVLPALALGAEPPEPDVMERPPRSRRERLFSLTVMGRILFLGGIQALGVCVVFFWHIHASGIPYSDFTEDDTVYREAITLVQAGIVVSQFFNALAVRTDRQSIFRIGLLSNPWLLAAGCFGIGLMAAISYLPALQAVFHTAPLAAADWAVLGAFGVLLLAAEETRKWWLRCHRPVVGKGGKR
ncbi:cation-transporting P-type ATPase [Streptomyces sp. NEAU-S7GS2]|uniref:cation-translocating P-type ATPase n=1 Tax=Streptomyces sp. NEAU-S7GS2 TaxID=2202000 RepID=UPI000D6EC9CB|nr:cation-transporting P-type ATPase [Streptomyces sp. NEAU-S7GS2]AWN30595.1 cation-transporting ATPase [Streptomyces sp. NEAU-S7GS2]